MADAYGLPTSSRPGSVLAPETEQTDRVVFRGKAGNMVVGVALVIGGAAAFVMGMTDVFFAEAMAWTFVIWGALFLFADLIDYTSSWTVTPEALEVRSALRFWQPVKIWNWENINRFEVVVKRDDPKPEDVQMLVFFTPEGDSVIEREDRVLSPQLARMILERSGLRSTNPANPIDMEVVPAKKAQYIWNRSGKVTTAS